MLQPTTNRILLLAIIAMCSCETGTAAPRHPTEDVQSYVRDTLKVWCEVWFDCPGGPLYFLTDERYFLNTFGSKEACLAAVPQLAPMFGEAEIIEAVAAGRLRFDPVEGARCLEHTRRQECGEEAELDACDFIFEGLVEEGDHCAVADACESGECQPLRGSCFGKCGSDLCLGQECERDDYCDPIDGCVPFGEPGDACRVFGCAEGSQCNGWAFELGVCVEEGSISAGEPCDDDATCESGECGLDRVCLDGSMLGADCQPGECGADLLCNVGATGVGVCIWPGTVGEGEDCSDSRACRARLTCDPETASCEARRHPDGAPCDTFDECESGFCSGVWSAAGGVCAERASLAEGEVCATFGACQPELWCDVFGTGVCRRLADVGESCHDGARPIAPAFPCLPGLACLDFDDAKRGTCGPLRQFGEPCQSWSQCAAPNGCIDGQCAPRKGPRAACETAFDCESYRCDGATSTCWGTDLCGVPAPERSMLSGG